MGKCRFLSNNLITDESLIAVSSLKLGVVTTALKEGTGSAILTPSGAFTYPVDLEYVVEIDGLGTGETGSSTFKWSDDGGATWDVTGVPTPTIALAITDSSCGEGDGTYNLIFSGANTTPATGTYTVSSSIITVVNLTGGGTGYPAPPTVATQSGDGIVTASFADLTLNNGVKVAWAAGTGADFVLGDKWYFKGINLYNPGKMLDFDRDSRFRTAVITATTITITFTGHQSPTVLILYDHNLAGASASVTLQGNHGALENVTVTAGKILHYLATPVTPSETWVITIINTAPATYIEIGELFLGTYMEFSKNYKIGFGEEPGFLMDTNITSYGVDRDRFYAESKTFNYEFSVVPSADVTLKRAFVTALSSGSTGIFKRFWFNANSATPSDVIMAKLISWPHTHVGGDFYDMPLQITEVLKSI
jgi:hypothetical protein